MKNVVLAFLQCVLFLVVFTAGSFFPPFHLEHVFSMTAEGTHIFVWDGLLLAILLYLLILLIETLRRRIRSAGLWTTAAFAIAIAVGLAAKIGFKTIG